MWSYADVAQGLADAADTIAGLRTHADIPGQLVPPSFVVDMPQTVGFDQTMRRGSDVLTITCGVYVSAAHNRTGQAQLMGYLAGSGATSLKEALEVDPTLAGACQTLRVVEARNFGLVSSSADNAKLLTCELVVEVVV